MLDHIESIRREKFCNDYDAKTSKRDKHTNIINAYHALLSSALLVSE